jgi:ankyrin repeat protein
MRRASVSLLSLLAAGVLGSPACMPRPQNALSVAAARGDVAAIERILNDGGDPNLGAQSRAFTPLIWAARAGQVAAIRVLVARGADLNAPGGVNDWVPLQHALHKGRTEASRVLLDLGADISGSIGPRALAMAAGYGNATITQALLDRGVDPHIDLGAGPSLLALAAAGAYDIDYRYRGCEPHTETLRAILTRAPDLTLGDGPWDRAARVYVQRHGCGEMIALLK